MSSDLERVKAAIRENLGLRGQQITDLGLDYGIDQAAQAALTAMQPSADVQGWRVVPVEPTEEMVGEAIDNAGPIGCCNHTAETARETYRAMLAAAPTPPGSPEPSPLPADVLEKVKEVLSKIMPIRVHDGADYAEVFFSDGIAHSTQAMTMSPQDWRDIATLLTQLTATDGQGGGK